LHDDSKDEAVVDLRSDGDFLDRVVEVTNLFGGGCGLGVDGAGLLDLGMFIVNLVEDSVSVLFGLAPEGIAFGSPSPEEKTGVRFMRERLHCVEGKPILCGRPAGSS
jgi:hypothetical protein